MARAAQAAAETLADKILAELVGHGDQKLAIRDSVRRLFDEAVASTRHFDQALVVLFTRGIETGMSATPKRTRKKRAANGAPASTEGAEERF